MGKAIIPAGIGVAVVAGIIFFAVPQKSTVTQIPTSTAQPQSDSRYMDYSPAAYAVAANKKRVLYFYATWCPTCSVANEDFTFNAGQIPEDVIVFRTDYDNESELKHKYAITYQHTFVQVGAAGNELAKWNGGGLKELLSNLK